MTKRLWYRDNLIWFSIALSVFSCGFDGAFLSGLMWINTPWLGVLFGQGLNFAADAVTHVLGNQFAEEQRKAPRKSKRWWLSFVLLAGDVAAVYYSIVFSWYQIRLNWESLPAWLQWSAASFAPAGILLLGVARALRDANIKTEAKQQESETKREAIAISEPPPLVVGFHCDYCDYVADTQNGLNAHQRKHAVKVGNNGNGRLKIEEVR